MPSYPFGKIYEGYGGIFSKENKHGVDIVRTFVFPSQSARMLPRLLNYFSFVCSALLFGAFALSSADYLLVESPPLFLGVSAIVLSRIKGAKLIFNVSDLWPESAVRLGVVRSDGLAYKLALRLEELCYRKAWVITGQSRSILDNIKSRFCSAPTLLLSNGADTDKFSPERYSSQAKSLLSPNGECSVLYAGLHGLAQGLGQLIEAAKALHSEAAYRFVFVGDGPERKALMARVEKDGIANAFFLGPYAGEGIPPLLASADVVIVPLAMELPGAVPSKLYEAMASGCAIILLAEGEAAEIVRQTQSGLVVSPGDIQSLVQSIKYLRNYSSKVARMRRNARQTALKQFDRTIIAKAFIEYLTKDLNASRNSAGPQEYPSSCFIDAR